jgi:hypothetical protein
MKNRGDTMAQFGIRTFAPLVLLLAASGCASVPPAPAMKKGALAESLYVIQPWAQQPPVDIYRRVAAIQGALAGVQQSVNSYYSAINAQAAEHNRRVFLQAELARAEAAQRRLQAERMAAERANSASQRQILTPAKFDSKKVAMPRAYDDTGWKLGEALYQNVHGWTQWSRHTFWESMRNSPH